MNIIIFKGLRGSGLNEAGGGNHPAGQLTLNQMHDLAMARSLVPGSGQMGHGAYVPAQSPPTLFQQQQIPQPMPPRPRPEGKCLNNILTLYNVTNLKLH